MVYNPEIHQRKSIRLKGYDYSKAGLYFVTICTHNRESLFGEIIDEKLVLNEFGELVKQQWIDLPKHYPNIKLDEYCIMPNHFHCIIEIVGAGLTNVSIPFCSNPPENGNIYTGQVREEMQDRICKTAPTRHCLSEIMRGFKTYTAKYINRLRKTSGVSVWQRNYYEIIIKNEEAYLKISEYIRKNPLLWNEDKYFS